MELTIVRKGLSLNTEVKTKWLEALRSGKYKQGRGKLCSADREYCCLGVLIDVMGLWDDKDYPGDLRAGGHSGILCYKHETELDLRDTDILMGMNDRDGKTFLEIADWIEENL